MLKNGKQNFCKIVGITVVAMVVIGMTGCGHNFGVNSKGVGVRASWQPDSLMPSINIGYYEVGTVAVRENAEGVYETDSVGALTGDATEGEATGTVGSKLYIKTAQQANGYTTKNEIFRHNIVSEPEEVQNDVDIE